MTGLIAFVIAVVGFVIPVAARVISREPTPYDPETYRRSEASR
jgi:hypothetical protein